MQWPCYVCDQMNDSKGRVVNKFLPISKFLCRYCGTEHLAESAQQLIDNVQNSKFNITKKKP